jgi:hypothetical protein
MIQPKISIEQALATLRKEYPQLTTREFNQRTSAVLNEAIRGAQTDVNRDVRQRYKGIPLKVLRKNETIGKANQGKLYAELNIKGRPIPINQLKGRQTKRGVTFNLMGYRELIAKAFVARLKIKRKNKATSEIDLVDKDFALARGKYTRSGNSGFMFQKGGRYPLDVVRTISPAGAAMHSDTQKAYMVRVEKSFEDRAFKVFKNFIERRR